MANIMHDYYIFGAEVPSRIYEIAAREFDEEEYTNIYIRTERSYRHSASSPEPTILIEHRIIAESDRCQDSLEKDFLLNIIDKLINDSDHEDI